MLLAQKLREIAEAEGIEAEPEALTVIAREGKGSFRDAEGLLDQLASFADGPITAVGVRELLGSVGSEVLLETTDALYERRSAEALRIVDRLQDEGKDLSRFVGELVAHLRRLVLLTHAPEVALAEIGTEEQGALEEQTRRIPTVEVVRMIEALGDTLSRAKRGGDPKLELELTFLKLTRDYEEPRVDALLRRLEALEQAIENGVANAAAVSRPLAETSSQRIGSDSSASEKVTEENGGAPEPARGLKDPEAEEGDEPGELDLEWDSVLQALIEQKQKTTETIFKGAWASSFDGETLELSFPREQAYLMDLAKDSRYQEPLRRVLEEHLGTRPRLEFRIADEDGAVAGGAVSRGTPKGASEPEEPLRRGDTVSEEPSESETTESTGGEDGGAADMIQSQQEVFEMAREWFDPGSKHNGDS
jgi:DNA polymerase-3 subunit gamma/tau